MRTRSLAGIFVFVVGLLVAGCSSDSKKQPASGSVWAGKTYLLNIPDTRWKKPSGDVGKEVGRFVPKMIFNLENGTDGVDVLFGTSDAQGVQNTCSPTLETKAAAPEKQIGPITARLHITNDLGSSLFATAHDLTLTNILSETPEATVQAGQFTARLDVREVYSLFHELGNPTADAVCETLKNSFSTPCVACPDGQSYCLDLMAVGLVAKPLTNGTVEAVESEAPSCIKQGSDAGT
jgi:hypothetical protein